MKEKRYKLSQKQFDSLETANKRVDQAQTALANETRQLVDISELILDCLGIPVGTATRVDQKTLEIVVPDTEPDDF